MFRNWWKFTGMNTLRLQHEVSKHAILQWLSLLARKSVCFFVPWLAPQSIATKLFSWHLSPDWLLPRKPTAPLFSSWLFHLCLLLRYAVTFFVTLSKRLSITTKCLLLVFSPFLRITTREIPNLIYSILIRIF